MLSSFSTWLMLEGDNCLIYEFYNVVEFLSSSLILSELFIKEELVYTWSEGKGERWSPNFFPKDKVNFDHLHIDRGMDFFSSN